MLQIKWVTLFALCVWMGAWLCSPILSSHESTSALSLTAARAAEPPPGSPPPVKTNVHEEVPDYNRPSSGVRAASKARPKPQKTALSETSNLLILGLDKKPGEVGTGRPDTLVIAALSQESEKLGLISVPRDLYVDIEGHGPDRINSAYAVALRQKKDPVELTKRVLEDTLKLPIHHTMTIDLSAFEALVDALGGVHVDVTCPISDNFIDPRTTTGRRLLDVEAGRVFMDGVTAGLYARSRHGRSDLSRARRQQAILLGIKDRFLSSPGLFRLGEVLSTLDGLVKTDMSRAEMVTLGAHAAKLQKDDIHGLVLGYREAVPTVLPDGKQVLVPSEPALLAALEQLFTSPLPGAEPENAACFSKDAALVGR
jgi:LCP family protein required for cell wall assembly